MHTDMLYVELRYSKFGYGEKTLSFNDLMQIATEENISVSYVNFDTAPEIYSAYPKPRIFLRADLDESKRWFFLGHSLGHHFLHPMRVGPRCVYAQNELGIEDFENYDAALEREADAFSVSTFLPNAVLVDILDRNSNDLEAIIHEVEDYTRDKLDIKNLSPFSKRNLRNRLKVFILYYIHHVKDKEDPEWCKNRFCTKIHSD